MLPPVVTVCLCDRPLCQSQLKSLTNLRPFRLLRLTSAKSRGPIRATARRPATSAPTSCRMSSLLGSLGRRTVRAKVSPPWPSSTQAWTRRHGPPLSSAKLTDRRLQRLTLGYPKPPTGRALLVRRVQPNDGAVAILARGTIVTEPPTGSGRVGSGKAGF
jgi:hypothetical protein